MATSWLSAVWSHPIGARIAYYPTLLFGVLKTTGERKWYNRVDENVLLGALPLWSYAKELTKNENVRGVVTLNEAYETRYLCPDAASWKKLGAQVPFLIHVDQHPQLIRIVTGC